MNQKIHDFLNSKEKINIIQISRETGKKKVIQVPNMFKNKDQELLIVDEGIYEPRTK